jgi:hypothetical protein
MTKPLPLHKRKNGFWLHVNKNGPIAPNMSTPCWLWTGSIGKGGYGSASYRGRTVSAHRAAWEMTNGRIPDGLCVLHKCDARNCVRNDVDAHLFIGTHKDNMNDMYAKGRGPIGIKNGSHTKPNRRACGDRNGTRTHPESRQRGSAHWTRRMPDKVKGENNNRAKLTDADVKEILCLYQKGGRTQESLAHQFGVTQVHVSKLIRNGRSGIRG